MTLIIIYDMYIKNNHIMNGKINITKKNIIEYLKPSSLLYEYILIIMLLNVCFFLLNLDK